MNPARVLGSAIASGYFQRTENSVAMRIGTHAVSIIANTSYASCNPCYYLTAYSWVSSLLLND